MSFTIDAEAGTFTESSDTITIKDGAITIPAGNTAQRSQNPIAGMIRFNTDNAILEGYNGSNWETLRL